MLVAVEVTDPAESPTGLIAQKVLKLLRCSLLWDYLEPAEQETLRLDLQACEDSGTHIFDQIVTAPKGRRNQITRWLIDNFKEAVVRAATSDPEIETELMDLQKDVLKYLDGVDPWRLVAPIEVA